MVSWWISDVKGERSLITISWNLVTTPADLVTAPVMLFLDRSSCVWLVTTLGSAVSWLMYQVRLAAGTETGDTQAAVILSPGWYVSDTPSIRGPRSGKSANSFLTRKFLSLLINISNFVNDTPCNDHILRLSIPPG